MAKKMEEESDASDAPPPADNQQQPAPTQQPSQQLVAESSSHGNTASDNDRSERHKLKQNAMDCTLRLAELLKAIAKKTSRSNSDSATVGVSGSSSSRPENPGPSGDHRRPLRKAKFSWQVKNLSGQLRKTSDVGESDGRGESDGAGSSSSYRHQQHVVTGDGEPPTKKAKLLSPTGHPSSVNTGDVQNISSSSESSLSSPSSMSVDSDVSMTDSTRVSPRADPETPRSRSVSVAEADSVQTLPPPAARSSSVLQSWQSKHIAQSIVDNAINATLEVLGYSLAVGAPGPQIGPGIAPPTRSNHPVEEDAVSAVIRARGLQGSTGNLESDHAENVEGSTKLMEADTTVGRNSASTGHNPLNPLISQLAQFRRTSLSSTSSSTTAANPASTTTTPAINTTNITTPQQPASEPTSPNQDTNTTRDIDQELKLEQDSGGQIEKQSDSQVDLDNLFPPALQSDVLNKAVSAAISQKGLMVDENL